MTESQSAGQAAALTIRSVEALGGRSSVALLAQRRTNHFQDRLFSVKRAEGLAPWLARAMYAGWPKPRQWVPRLLGVVFVHGCFWQHHDCLLFK